MLLSTPLNGVEDYLLDGWNGILMERSTQGVTAAVRRFLALSPEERQTMGSHASASMAPYSMENYSKHWRELYTRIQHEQA